MEEDTASSSRARSDTRRIADELCQGYIAHSLGRKGFSDAIPPRMAAACRSADTSRVLKRLQPLADSFEDSNPEVFRDLILRLDVTAETAYKSFVDTSLELFDDGIKWGRIVGLYALSAAVAVECVRRNLNRFIVKVYEWLFTFITDNLLEWIVDHSGWEGFMEFYGQREQGANDHFWTFNKIGGVVAMGGLLAAALFMK